MPGTIAAPGVVVPELLFGEAPPIATLSRTTYPAWLAVFAHVVAWFWLTEWKCCPSTNQRNTWGETLASHSKR